MGKNDRAESHLSNSPSKERSNPHRYRKIKLLQQNGIIPIVQIVAAGFVRKEDAGVYERSLILLYGRQCNNTGVLCNIKPGGIGGRHIVREDYTSNTRVDQYDLCGKYIQTFISEADAARTVCNGKKGTPQAISQCCHQSGNNKSYKGYFWTLAGNPLDTEWCWVKTKPVYQWSLSGQLIKMHANSSTAAREVDVARSTIGDCLHGKLPRAGDFMWSYNDIPPVYNGKRKSVMCVETKQVFKSIGEAANYFDVDRSYLASVCRGVHTQCKGHTFIYT
jgi:hypothetical protein